MSICSQSSVNRIEESLRNTWRRLARQMKIYLACRETVLEKRHSGANEEDEEDFINELYRKKAGKKDKDGVFMYLPPFKYRDAAEKVSKSRNSRLSSRWESILDPVEASRLLE